MKEALGSFKLTVRRWTGVLAGALGAPQFSHAATAAGGITEWETPLQKVVASIDGPVAFGISVIGIVVAGAMLIWGGEINEFSRKLIMLVLVLALIVAAVNLLSTLFGVGALVV